MGLNIKDLRIGSPAFTTLEPIPKRYTSEGENISPPSINLSKIDQPCIGIYRLVGRIFDEGWSILDKFLVPPLEWSTLPSGTQQLVLICHDPDASLVCGFTHGTIYIWSTVTWLVQASGSKFTQGTNSNDKLGYTGPAPPNGHELHRYYFWLYALDKELDLKPGLRREQLLGAIASLCHRVSPVGRGLRAMTSAPLLNESRQ